MTAVEKAQELFLKFYVVELSDGTHLDKEAAIDCALIAVDDILEILYSLKLGNALSEELEYYEQVKHELNKSE